MSRNRITSARPSILPVRWRNIGSIAAIGTLCAFASQVAAQPAAELSNLYNQFQTLNSVHVAVDGTIYAPVICGCLAEEQLSLTAPLNASYEYWASGNNYYFKSWAEPDKYPGVQTEAAFDGQKFQLLRSDGTLSQSSTDTDTLLPALPNPLWELVQFRHPLTDQNYNHELRLTQIKQDQVPASFWDVQWYAVPEFGQPLERAVFPGGTYEGKAYVHHVYTPEGEHNKPVRIDRVQPNGKLLTRTEFSNYQQVAGGWWPHQIMLHTFDDAGKFAGYISYSVTDFAVDPTPPSGVFSLNESSAQQLWDDESVQFVETLPAE